MGRERRAYGRGKERKIYAKGREKKNFMAKGKYRQIHIARGEGKKQLYGRRRGEANLGV